MSGILIDTSVWVEALRKTGDRTIKYTVSDLLLKKEAQYTCPIMFELISGARDHELKLINQYLAKSTYVVFETPWWKIAASHYRELRKTGITVPFDDIQVATAASQAGLTLLCRDRHFDIIAEQTTMTLKLEQMA